MYKNIVAVVLAVGLISAAGPALIQSASAQTTTTAKTTKKPSTAQIALRERQKKCGAEWKSAKKAGKVEKGTKWPQFWSACNKRLKAGG
jgi:hypothetical protein